MIITNRIVVLNFPKTGSTFVRNVLKKIHRADNIIARNILKAGLPYNGIRELIMASDMRGSQYKKKMKGQHSTFSQIPERFKKNRKIVTVFRNPLERYVSTYEFKWYAKNSFFKDNPECLKDFPNFPDLTFKEYMDMQFKYGVRQYAGDHTLNADIGPTSLQFIRFIFPNPDEVISNLNNRYIDNDEYVKDTPDIEFLHTENLNDELYDFLKENGYAEDKIAFIKQEAKANYNRQNWKKDNWKNYYTDELLRKIQYYDRLLFKIFPEYRL